MTTRLVRESAPVGNHGVQVHTAKSAPGNRGCFYPYRCGHVHRPPRLIASPRLQTVIDGASGETSVSLLLYKEKIIGNNRCRLVACSLCGKERWVRLVKGVPRSLICRECCSADTRLKMSEAHFGHTVSVETRRKISESKKGCSRNDIKGENNPAKRPEVREKISNAAKGRYVSDITRNKLSVLNLGKKLSLETRHKISVANKGKPHKEPISEETRQKLRVSHLGQKQSIKSRLSTSIRTRKMWGDGEYRKKTLGRLHSQEARVKASISRIGHEVSQSTREKIRASLMGHEFPEKTRIKWIKSMREALHARPNKSEKILFSILCRLYPGQWAFVGDWTMVLDGKCPDFVNRNGRKLIIELFGDYWHKGEDGKQRANIFSKFGYKTLIVWESELKNVDTLVVKIQDFVNEKS